MGKKVPYIGQAIKWIGGLLAVWLLVLLPIRAIDSSSVPARQLYTLSVDTPSVDDQSDFSSLVYGYEAVALVGPHAGFSFLPSLLVLPWVLSAFYRLKGIALPGRRHDSYFSFGFLLPIFEHQIAINAP
ncbi:hypothetical protein [Spirosoma utsteinense]|uniref:hypothetical protein n=1 Tax=Spirosoma utsteinense TaxID=2585773 RepID=UPI0016488803|nr:hypothetical protein [Spirosoma utsteinense]MBC3788734.1 hypothetical protein [Spirosoma utsteinense]